MVQAGNAFKKVVMINIYKMKNLKLIYSTIAFILLSISINAQVGIGKNNIDGISTIIDFDNSSTNTKGIILPAVTTAPTNLNTSDNGGTLIYDLSDSKVKMFQNGTWVSLSETGDKSKISINNSNEVGNGVIIGAATSQAKGSLILESSNRAIILPKINSPDTSVKSPYPGMICYDTASKTIAIFDGKVWNYWK